MPPQKRLTLKSRAARSLAGELAELTGETMTRAVTLALREHLARLDHEARNAPVGFGQRGEKLLEQKT